MMMKSVQLGTQLITVTPGLANGATVVSERKSRFA